MIFNKHSFKRVPLITLVAGLVLITGFFITSCSAARYMDTGEQVVHEAVEMADEKYPDQPEIADEEAISREIAAEEAPRRHEQAGEGEPQRKVIRRGSINLAVEDTRAGVEKIRSITREFNGLIDHSSIYEIREGQYGARLTIRIPEESFEEVMAKLETLGKATEVRTELEDVTDQYIDLESRLNNQKVQEERLSEILEMAESVEEVLEVEKELQRVRGEIESMSARLDRLKDQITYSTINITMREEAVPTGAISPHSFDNLGNRIAEAFTGGVNFLLSAVSIIIVVFSAILPALVILVGIALITWYLIRRYLRRKNAAIGHSDGSNR